MFSTTLLMGVMAGGALGGALRAFVARAGARYWGDALPWGTLVANHAAALALGALAGGMAQSQAAGLFWAFAATGALGGLSTVSSLVQQALSLWQESRRRAACAYLALSAGGGIVLAAVGYTLGDAVALGGGV